MFFFFALSCFYYCRQDTQQNGRGHLWSGFGMLGQRKSKSTTEIQSFKPGAPTKESESVNKYFQDDNSHNLYFHKNIHCHTRSRSASRCENKSRTEEPIGATSLTKLNNDFKGNINYDVPEKCANFEENLLQ